MTKASAFPPPVVKSENSPAREPKTIYSVRMNTSRVSPVRQEAYSHQWKACTRNGGHDGAEEHNDEIRRSRVSVDCQITCIAGRKIDLLIKTVQLSITEPQGVRIVRRRLFTGGFHGWETDLGFFGGMKVKTA